MSLENYKGYRPEFLRSLILQTEKRVNDLHMEIIMCNVAIEEMQAEIDRVEGVDTEQ